MCKKQVSRLGEHLKRHLLAKEKVKCEVCEKELKKTAMNGHMKSHTNVKISFKKCSVCNKEFQNLKEHMIIHDNYREKVDCKICNTKVFDIKKHMYYMHKERKYECNICHKQFVFEVQLKEHHSINHMDKESRNFLSCKLCSKKLLTKKSLKYHMTTHQTHRELFTCEICSQKFVSKQSLRDHGKVHGEAENHQCKLCPTILKTKKTLTKHMKTHDVNRKTFSCDTCGKKILTSCGLKIHLKTHQTKNVIHTNDQHESLDKYQSHEGPQEIVNNL